MVANFNCCHHWVLFPLSESVLVTQTDFLRAMVDTAFRVVLYLDICIGLGALSVLQSPGPAMDGNGTMPVARRACLDREGVRGAGGVSTPSGSHQENGSRS